MKSNLEVPAQLHQVRPHLHGAAHTCVRCDTKETIQSCPPHLHGISLVPWIARFKLNDTPTATDPTAAASRPIHFSEVADPVAGVGRR